MISSMMRRLKTLFPQRGFVRLSWHWMKSFVASLCYGFPARKLVVIGITGTDGKTTTVGMAAHILQSSGRQTGALSTAFFQIGDVVKWNATQKTFPSPFVVQRFLRRLVSERCSHVVLEYSSHGLVQGRGNWTWPDVAGITNTTQEHLDYHGTMEQYRRDKGILFSMLGRSGTKVLNGVDDSFETFREISTGRTIVYGSSPRTVAERDQGEFLWADEIIPKQVSTSATIRWLRGSSARTEEACGLELAIPGTFNVENALCAIGCSLACGVSLQQATSTLRTFRGIPGRMERIDGSQPFSVFVDFTVTPAAYEKTLSALHALLAPGKRLLVLTGSCGDRMREKRPAVGKICSDYADVVVVTNEDPYSEDPERIIDEVWAGVDQSKTEARRFSDRMEAIKFILSEAKEGDIVLLCGKGSDTTMMTASGQIPWDEREIVRTFLMSHVSMHE